MKRNDSGLKRGGRCVTLFALLVSMALSASVAADVFSCNFASPVSDPQVKIRRSQVSAGILKMDRGATFAVDLGSGVPAPCEITYRVRIVERFKPNGAAFMLNVSGGEAASGLFSLRDGKMIESYFYSHGKKAVHPALKGDRRHADGVWHSVKLRIGGKYASFFVDGRELVVGEHTGFSPLKRFTLSAYCVTAELDDVRVTALKDEKPSEIEKPTFFCEGPLAHGARIAVSNPVSSKIGGVMFWARAPKGGEAFRLEKGGRSVLTARLAGNGAAARAVIHVARGDGEKPIEFTRTYFGVPGDWVLVTLTWNEFGETRYFINTLPYVDSLTLFGQRMPSLTNPDLDGIDALVVPAAGKTTCEVRGLTIFHRRVTNREVCDVYRRTMPYDVVLDENIVDSGRPVPVVFQFAPGGTYTLPAPAVPLPKTKGTDDVTFTVMDAEGKVMAKEQKRLTVDREIDVALSPLVFTNGNYRVQVDVGGRYRRTFKLSAFVSDYRPEYSSGDIELGELLYERIPKADDADILTQGTVAMRSLGGVDYLEAGSDVTDRFSWRIPFPAETSGQPVVLELEWPDDKERLMGLYMYKPAYACRDHLQQGISSGREIPLSGEMRKQRFIFYPTYTNWLFEARTLAPKMPAAVRAVRIYAIRGGRLPANAIALPEGMEGRHFGFYDEDQTFHNNLNADAMSDKVPCGAAFRSKYPCMLAFQNDEYYKYFDYIGMDTVTEPVWRYHSSMVPGDGKILGGLWPAASLGWTMKEFGRRGQRFVASLYFFALPEMYEVGRIDAPYLADGMGLLDKDGDPMGDAFMGKHPMNPSHPTCIERLLAHVRAPVKRYAKQGLTGIQWDLTSLGTWYKLERGYDDYSTGLFTRETGIAVPAELSKRYAYLTGEKRGEWLRWRAGKVTEIVRAMRTMLDGIDPELTLQIVVPRDAARAYEDRGGVVIGGGNSWSERDSVRAYVDRGIDLSALGKIPNVTFCVNHLPTVHRHDMHWAKEERTTYEEMYDMAGIDLNSLARGGLPPAVRSDYTYFETFVHSLDRKTFGSYFENADVKAHGRFFLREMAFALAAYDTCEYIAGAQPLPSVGHEAESREFARAFRALPARRFKDVGGSRDPVVSRYLETENGTYFYLVNLFHEPVVVSLDFGGFWANRFMGYKNLSSGKTEKGGTFTLDAFEVKSYLVPEKSVKVRSLGFVSTTDSARMKYAARLKELEAAADTLEKSGIDVKAERETLARLKALMRSDRWAELYRLAYSRRMYRLLENRSNVANMLAEQEMRKTGAWRVNCGGNGYTKLADGRVFLPDRAFDGGYGYENRHESTTRDVTGMKLCAEAELYKTESYHLGRYRFRVPPGRYTVNVYLKCGWPRGFKEGSQRFSLTANGRDFVKGGVNLWRMQQKDFTRPVTVTIRDVAADKGEIVLDWRPLTREQTEPLANGIEIVPQP